MVAAGPCGSGGCHGSFSQRDRRIIMTKTLNDPASVVDTVRAWRLEEYLRGTEIVVTTAGTLLQGAPVLYLPRHDGDRHPWYALASEGGHGWRYRHDEVGPRYIRTLVRQED
jgi:hypothetical protein